MNSYMNTYLFINTTRKGPPTLEYIVQAKTPEEAIKQVLYYPFDMEEDFLDEFDNPIETMEGKIEVVFGWYGLNDNVADYEGNGIDGYGTMLIEVSDYGTIGKVFGNKSFDQKDLQTEPAVYDPTPVIGYGEGLVRSNRKPMYTVTDRNNWFHIDGLYYNVHPYREDLGGYPVRWLQDELPGS